MARAFYSEYVNHCLRFYARHQNPKFKSEADKKNWNCSKKALESFTEKEQEILLEIYRDNETVPNKVYELAESNHMKADAIWKLINDLERKVAKYRDLL